MIVIKSILELHIIHYIDTYIADKELLYQCFSSPFSYMQNITEMFKDVNIYLNQDARLYYLLSKGLIWLK